MIDGHRDRCLILAPTFSLVGGAERVVCDLSLGLSARHWDVRTVFPVTDTSPALLDWCREHGVNAEASFAVPTLDQPRTLASTRALRQIVRRTNAAVVNVHYGSIFASIKDVLAVRTAGMGRCVLTMHSAVGWDYLGERKRQMTGLAGNLCHAVVAVSQATRDLLLEAGVHPTKVHVIHPGVRAPERLPGRGEARARLGLPMDAFVVATLGRLMPEKGVADLIEAVARIPDPEERLILVVGGDGPERPALEALAAQRLGPHAVFLGAITGDTADFYASADVFALASHLEGFGKVYIEAALHNVPSVGTNVGGASSAIEEGTTGFLVPPRDPAAMAAHILRLREDPALRSQLGEAARRRAEAEFSVTVMLDRYTGLFDDLRARRKPSYR